MFVCEPGLQVGGSLAPVYLCVVASGVPWALCDTVTKIPRSSHHACPRVGFAQHADCQGTSAVGCVTERKGGVGV